MKVYGEKKYEHYMVHFVRLLWTHSLACLEFILLFLKVGP